MFRTTKRIKFITSIFCIAVFLAVATVTLAKAQSQFDGTYDYSYTYDWAGAWTTRDLGSVFIISNSQVSMSGTSDFFGSVDSSGYVQFSCPSPLGGEQATFSGTISSGSGGGTWSTPSGAHGNWGVTLVNGGGASFNIGGNPTSWSIAAVAGTLVVLSMIGAHRYSVSRSKKLPQPLGPSPTQMPQKTETKPATGWSSSPANNPTPPPPTLNPITGGSNYHLEDYGVVRAAISEVSTLPYMDARWFDGGVLLAWGRPQYDPSKYRLLQFDITQMTYGPNSTVSQPTGQTVVPDDGQSTAFTQNRYYVQTYTNNTGGDVAGFRVDPVFQDLQTGHTFHAGGLGVKIGQATGTYGVGP
jgi:hypothetical protein